ncbi:MFS transporter [Rhodococcus sp. Z13]|uniref:MFS transporter n=1 Tax=Rhodococcus sacchari TaxID=2962047 RepID=A0ACD4DDA2_9NOCA|nr:MFS transporter [Rhodococcus sp. Z13]UYP18060.1 MFS transporter [Rhodococcus sp. Z13]
MTAPVSPRGGIRLFGFAVAGLGAFTLTASSSAPSPLYPVYQQMWGFSAAVLTVVFAAYVLALLAALVTVGALSDHVGRKPVVIVSLLALTVSMLVFIAAEDAGWLIVARVIQGAAMGTATGALSAAVIEFQPGPRIGPLINTTGPSLGLALGAACAGLLVQYAPFPTVLVYALIAVLALGLAVAAFFVPETSPSVGFESWRQALRSLLPSASVPREVRAPFLLVLPSLVSAWALSGIYMSLGPSLMESVFGIDNRLAGGLIIGSLFTAGTVAAVLSTRRAPYEVVVVGGMFLTVGLAMVITGLGVEQVVLYYLGTVIAGFGWGATFLGAMNVIGALGAPAERSRIFATTYVVCYLAFSVPAMIAGVAAGAFGLTATAVGYGTIVASVALGSGVVLWFRRPVTPSRMQKVPEPISAAGTS